ncbi:MAG: hypothetical protein ABIZ81_05570 [Opitutaceae bacterium]
MTLLLALLLFRIPEFPGAGEQSSYRMLLDLSFRPSPGSDLSVGTLDGPLKPLQHPIYTGRSIWRTLTWQMAGNLAMVAVVVAGAYRLPGARRWWALALFVVFAIADTSVAPWITILVLGGWIASHKHAAIRGLSGVGVGILASTSIAHLLLSVASLVFAVHRPIRTENLRSAASPALGFLGGLLGTWLVLDQSLLRLGQWIGFGLTHAWTPSAMGLTHATTTSYPWAALTAAAWIVALIFCRKSLRETESTWPAIFLISWGALVAWKWIALQPGGTPWLFLVTLLFGAFVLLPIAPVGAAAVFVTAIVGGAMSDRILVIDALARANRRLLENITEVRTLPGLRDRLRQHFAAYGAGFDMPQTRTALAGGPVGIIGDHSTQVLLNEFRATPSASFGTQFVRDDAAARRNAAAVLATGAPPFWLQRIDQDNDVLPGLRDGPAQLALYQAYEFVLNEQSLSLWKKKSVPVQEVRTVVREGTARFGERITLPRDENGCWLELEPSPNWIGLVLDQVKPLTEPALRVITVDGTQIRYTLPWRMARAGFLTRPFFRGDIDVWRFEEGNAPPEIDHVIVDSPSSTRWAWRRSIHYRVYRLAPLVPKRAPNLTATLEKQYAALNRLPISVSAPFSPVSGIVDDRPTLFMHPDSVMEMAVTAKDRAIQGAFGIAAAAYTKPAPDVTDGVSFSVEFISAAGDRSRLFQRYLDPASAPDDRGTQTFAVALPSFEGGRLLLRTFNSADKTSSFDWSYWRQIELK